MFISPWSPANGGRSPRPSRGVRALPTEGPRPTTKEAVLQAILSAHHPRLAPDPAPGWLRPSQEDAFSRALATVRRRGGCLIAEPVGTGKTWVGLAVAQTLEGAATCIVPAVLREQWSRVARRAGVPISLTTHEEWSRAPRPLEPGLILVDESHRFRTEQTNRVRNLAPRVVGRHGLLLTATPVVNRLADLIPQLLLFIRDDALCLSGTPSLRGALMERIVPRALNELVVTGTMSTAAHPLRSTRSLLVEPMRDSARLMTRLDRLRLTRNGAVRSLIRGVFALAESSSPAALVSCLQNYRLLLLQYADAGRDGKFVSRRTIRRLLLGDLRQTTMWSLFEDVPSSRDDLDTGDLRVLEGIIERARARLHGADPKAAALEELLADGRPSIVFVRSRATVDYLRRRLETPSGVAWASGSGAGIGTVRLRREDVLSWFRPSDQGTTIGPTVLITTDVSAEGLDLQRASRVVHYDLPWNPARLEQRTGRSWRLNGTHPEVEVVRFDVPTHLEHRIGLLAALDAKQRLPGKLGLGSVLYGRVATRRRGALRRPPHHAGWRVARVDSSKFRCVLAARLVAGERELCTRVFLQDDAGRWHDDGDRVAAALDSVENERPAKGNPALAYEALREADRVLQCWTRSVAGRLLRPHRSSPEVKAALRRLVQLNRSALQRRDRQAVRLAEQGQRFVRRGHTLGEALFVRRIGAATTDRSLRTLLSALGEEPSLELPIRLEPIALLYGVPAVPADRARAGVHSTSHAD